MTTELDWWERKHRQRHEDEVGDTAVGLARFFNKCVCGHPHGAHVQNKYIPTGGCLADYGKGICNCELFTEAVIDKGQCVSDNPLCVNHWRHNGRSHDPEGNLLDKCGDCE